MQIKPFFRLIIAAAICAALPLLAHAQCEALGSQFIQSACAQIAKPYEDGSWDLYVTGYTWHTGATFRGKHLNAEAYGGGLGKHWTDENGHQDLLYAFAFLDSHKDIE